MLTALALIARSRGRSTILWLFGSFSQGFSGGTGGLVSISSNADSGYETGQAGTDFAGWRLN